MAKIKSVLIVGNDPIAHVLLGWFFVWRFGWWGLLPAFFSHFLVDMIPHGHVEGVESGIKEFVKELLKGFFLSVILCLWIWNTVGFSKAIIVVVGISVSLFPDLLLGIANWVDKKELWQRFSNRKVFVTVKFIIGLNYLIHWFGRGVKLSYFLKLNHLWKEVENHNCGLSGNGIRPSWWNLAQPIMVTIFIVIFW